MFAFFKRLFFDESCGDGLDLELDVFTSEAINGCGMQQDFDDDMEFLFEQQFVDTSINCFSINNLMLGSDDFFPLCPTNDCLFPSPLFGGDSDFLQNDYSSGLSCGEHVLDDYTHIT